MSRLKTGTLEEDVINKKTLNIYENIVKRETSVIIQLLHTDFILNQ